MQLAEQLDAIQAAWLEADGENREETLEALRELHQSLLAQPEALAEFNHAAITLCGGLYIPYIFWFALRAFLHNPSPEHRAAIYKIIEAFATSNFEEQEQKIMKPLLIVYFDKEKEFEVDRVKAYIVDPAHPGIRQYFQKLFRFVEVNRSSVDTFLEKFRLLEDYFPDFDLYGMPLNRLREHLA